MLALAHCIALAIATDTDISSRFKPFLIAQRSTMNILLVCPGYEHQTPVDWHLIDFQNAFMSEVSKALDFVDASLARFFPALPYDGLGGSFIEEIWVSFVSHDYFLSRWAH